MAFFAFIFVFFVSQDPHTPNAYSIEPLQKTGAIYSTLDDCIENLDIDLKKYKEQLVVHAPEAKAKGACYFLPLSKGI